MQGQALGAGRQIAKSPIHPSLSLFQPPLPCAMLSALQGRLRAAAERRPPQRGAAAGHGAAAGRVAVPGAGSGGLRVGLNTSHVILAVRTVCVDEGRGAAAGHGGAAGGQCGGRGGVWGSEYSMGTAWPGAA